MSPRPVCECCRVQGSGGLERGTDGQGGTKDTTGCHPAPIPHTHLHTYIPHGHSPSLSLTWGEPSPAPPAQAPLPKKQVFSSLRRLGLPLYPSPDHLRQWESPSVMPRMCFALPCGHHLLVMFALMSYMLVSHGPSPLSQMSLWGDIPSLLC